MLKPMDWADDTANEVAKVIHDNPSTYGRIVGVPWLTGWWSAVRCELRSLGWEDYRNRRPGLRHPMVRPEGIR